MKFSKIVSAGLLAAAALMGSSAHAGFINGNVGIAGSFGALPGLPTSIVSTLVAMDVNSIAGVAGAGGDGDFSSLAGFGPATAFDFTIGVAPVNPLYTAGGFTFNLTTFVSNGSKAMDCTKNAGAQCVDSREFVGTGTVTGAGFDPTAFTVTWTATGSCNNSGGQCAGATGLSSASWTAQISAIGTAAPVPEPASLALVGLAMAGVALSRKGKKA